MTRLAAEADDRALVACTAFYHGHLLLLTGDYLRGLPTLEAGAMAVESLSPTDRLRAIGLNGAASPRYNVAYFHAIGGQFAKARRLAEQQIAALPPDTTAAPAVVSHGHGLNDAALAFAHTFSGQPAEARQAFARACERFRSRGAYYLVAHNSMSELVWVDGALLRGRPGGAPSGGECGGAGVYGWGRGLW